MNVSFLCAAAAYFRYCLIDYDLEYDELDGFVYDCVNADLVDKVAAFYSLDVDEFEEWLNDEDNEIVLALSLLRENFDVQDEEFDKAFGA